MIQRLEEFKRRIQKEKSQDRWVAIDKDDEARIAEWMLELDARIEKLEEKMKSAKETHNINVETVLDEVEIAMNAKIEARYALALRPASGYRKGWEAATIVMKEMLRDKLLE